MELTEKRPGPVWVGVVHDEGVASKKHSALGVQGDDRGRTK